ncbi:MAG TPA: hypothetical protein VNP73_08640, partial [Actinomycetota bacterium]|nr:hypothetical protein [Actinomycetota bacterium]
ATSDALLMNPAIDGSLVAWESIGGNANVKARYLGRRVQSLGGGPGDQIMPAVSGNWVAWWDLRRIPKIVARNMKTGARRVVTPSDDFTLMGPPGLGGRFVYWWQDSDFDGIGSIVRMDLKSKKRRTVVPQSSDFAPVWGLSITFPPVPSANDRFLVYTSEIAYLIEFAFDPDLIPNDQVGRDVFIVPISGGQVRPVTDNRADQAHPVIADGRRVLWLDSSQATTDLMTREVP